MTKYFEILQGQTNVENALRDRGLMGAWAHRLANPEPPSGSSYERKLEWRAGDFVATAIRFHREKLGLDFHAIVLTNDASDDMTMWHDEAKKQLARAADQGATEFEKAVRELMEGKG